MRQRYYVFVSACYLMLGLIMVIRSLWAHVFVVSLLGVVFIALGAVRLKDFFAWVRRPH